MTEAERIADLMSFEFMRRGNFSAAAGPIDAENLFPNTVMAAAAAEEQEGVFADETDGYANLSVQSVGFEEGVEKPKVHVYVNKGSIKSIRSLPKYIDNVQVVVHKTSNLLVKPEMASVSR